MKWQIFVSTVVAVLVMMATTSAAYTSTKLNQSRTGYMTASQVNEVVYKHFGRGYAGRVATCIVSYEASKRVSKGQIYYDLRSTSPAGDRGVFQVNPVHFIENGGPFASDRLYELHYNVIAAYRLSHGGTYWWPWVAEKGRCW